MKTEHARIKAASSPLLLAKSGARARSPSFTTAEMLRKLCISIIGWKSTSGGISRLLPLVTWTLTQLFGSSGRTWFCAAISIKWSFW